jgi:4-amino-4-deoxy-L-arabinose transferase-like glycosyltransferase
LGVLILNAIPLFNIGNLLMTIDPLSIFFWMAAMYAFWLALERVQIFLVLAVNWIARRARISLQVHKRI